MISPGERPAIAVSGRPGTDVPHPFTIVAGTPPRPATGRFRPQVRAANRKPPDVDDPTHANGQPATPVRPVNGKSTSPDVLGPPAPFRDIPARPDATPVRTRSTDDDDVPPKP